MSTGHTILKNHPANHDGDAGGDISREAKRRGRGGDILCLDERLQCNERGLEIWTDADARDDLVNDDAGPGRSFREIDVEAETERHEDHAEPDRGKVLAGFLDEDAYGRGDEGEGEDEGEGVHAA